MGPCVMVSPLAPGGFAQMKPVYGIRALAFAVVALLLEGWLATDRALATCGDYVVIGGNHLERGYSVHLNGGAMETGASQTAPAGPPCRGPNCSRRSAPQGAPPVTVAPHSQDWILPTVAWRDLSVEPLGVVHLDPLPHAHLRAMVVFRPPRSL